MKFLGINLLLYIAAAASAVPLLWLIGAAAHDPASGWTLANFTALLHRRPFGQWMLNSIFLSSAQTVLAVLISSLGGFGLAKYRFRGRNIILAVLLTTWACSTRIGRFWRPAR